MFELDPERALWKPGRRSFLFMFGAALVAPMLPNDTLGISGWVKDGGPGPIQAASGPIWYEDGFLEEVAVETNKTLFAMCHVKPACALDFVESRVYSDSWIVVADRWLKSQKYPKSKVPYV